MAIREALGRIERHVVAVRICGFLVALNILIMQGMLFFLEGLVILPVLSSVLTIVGVLLLNRITSRVVRNLLASTRREAGTAGMFQTVANNISGESAGYIGTLDALVVAAATSGMDFWYSLPDDRSKFRSPSGITVDASTDNGRQLMSLMDGVMCAALPDGFDSEVLYPQQASGSTASDRNFHVAPILSDGTVVGFLVGTTATGNNQAGVHAQARLGGFASIASVALSKAEAIDKARRELRENDLLLRSLLLDSEDAERDHLAQHARQSAEAVCGSKAIVFASAGNTVQVAGVWSSDGSLEIRTAAIRNLFRVDGFNDLTPNVYSCIGVGGTMKSRAECMPEPVRDDLASLGISEEIVVHPIFSGGEVNGLLIIDIDDSVGVDDRAASLLDVLSRQIASLFQRTGLIELIQRRSRHISCTPKLSRRLLDATTIEEIARSAVSELHSGFGFDEVTIALNKGGATDRADMLLRSTKSSISSLTKEMETVLAGSEAYVSCSSGTSGQSTIVVPIEKSGGGTVGVLAVTENDVSTLGSDDLHVLEAAGDYIAASLEQVELVDTLQKNYFRTVEALATALEAKDQYTIDHARSITELSAAVGRRMGMDERDIHDLKLGALLHDIGKIGVPHDILNKAGPLSDDEFEIMKQHTVIGEQIIAPLEFLAPVRPLVLHEHERFDGKGYPHGLEGEQIPMGARIIFVCDAWHAMTSNRPYREALDKAEAIKRMKAGAGTQFDPRVVEVFLEILEQEPALALAEL